jgi:hypothetical protein
MINNQPTQEDILIAKIVACLPDISVEDIFDLPESRGIDSFDPVLLRKAWWCYNIVTQATIGHTLFDRKEFINGFAQSWSIFYMKAAHAFFQNLPIASVNCELPPILLTYHFPEYPALWQIFRNKNVVPIVNRIAPWMGEGIYLLLNDHLIGKRIVTFLKKNHTVVGMLDHAYRHTRNKHLSFLGIPSLTPVGLFEIAFRLSLDIGLLYPQPSTYNFRIQKYLINYYESYSEVATHVLDDLSKTIMEKPQRWLLWPNLNHRWNLNPF